MWVACGSHWRSGVQSFVLPVSLARSRDAEPLVAMVRRESQVVCTLDGARSRADQDQMLGRVVMFRLDCVE